MGTHIHNPAGSPQSILTRGNGQQLNQTTATGTDRAKKNRGGSGSHGGCNGSTAWEIKTRETLTDLSTQLGLTVLESYALVSATPNELNNEDCVIRKELVTSIEKAGLPFLYAEGCLQRMVEGG